MTNNSEIYFKEIRPTAVELPRPHFIATPASGQCILYESCLCRLRSLVSAAECIFPTLCWVYDVLCWWSEERKCFCLTGTHVTHAYIYHLMKSVKWISFYSSFSMVFCITALVFKSFVFLHTHLSANTCITSLISQDWETKSSNLSLSSMSFMERFVYNWSFTNEEHHFSELLIANYMLILWTAHSFTTWRVKAPQQYPSLMLIALLVFNS